MTCPKDKNGANRPSISGVLAFTMILLLGWMVISSWQYLFVKYFISHLLTFWGLLMVCILITFFYIFIVGATTSGRYFFPGISIDEDTFD